jgi:hypothetical protein
MTLLLTNEDIAPLLDPAAVIDELDRTYLSFARGSGVTAPRLDLQAAQNAAGEAYQLGIAGGLSGRYGALRIKSDMTFRGVVDGLPRKEKYCVEPGTYVGLILLFSLDNGELLAILHDGLIQKMRVGADSALGARYLAREDASVLAQQAGFSLVSSTGAGMVNSRLGLPDVGIFSLRDNVDAVRMIARTDAIATDGIEAAVERAKAYEAAGADVIFPDAVRGADDIARIVEAVSIPVRINMGFGIRTRSTNPLMSVPELKRLGVRWISLSRMLPAAAIRGMSEALKVMRESIETGTVADRHDLVAEMSEIQALMDYRSYFEIERRFLSEAHIERKYGTRETQ